GAHLEPELGVEVGERLVHQHKRRLDNDRPRDRHALLLPARELPRKLLGVRLQLHEIERGVDLEADLVPRRATHGEAKADILPHAHVREERVVLEHHTEAALLRPEHVDALVVEPDTAARERQQPGNAVERGRLAAPRRAEQRDELAAPDREVETVEGDCGAKAPRHPIEAKLAKACRHYFFTFAPPISWSHFLKAATWPLASSGVSSGAPAISCSYSGRPNSLIASWLSFGAIESGTSFTAGP